MGQLNHWVSIASQEGQDIDPGSYLLVIIIAGEGFICELRAPITGSEEQGVRGVPGHLW